MLFQDGGYYTATESIYETPQKKKADGRVQGLAREGQEGRGPSNDTSTDQENSLTDSGVSREAPWMVSIVIKKGGRQ